MGLWADVRREVQRVLHTGGPAEGPSGGTTPESMRGPDPGSLVAADEIEAATGNRPLEESDRTSRGQEVDLGYSRACEWALSGGDGLLLNTTRFRDADAVVLSKARNADENEEEPLAGLGENGSFLVITDDKGGTELHVTAYTGLYAASLVHTSAAGATDVAPLKELMATVLSRLG